MAAARRAKTTCDAHTWRQVRAMLRADARRYLEAEWPRWRVTVARKLGGHVRADDRACFPCLVMAHYHHAFDRARDDYRERLVSDVVLHFDATPRDSRVARVRERLHGMSREGATWELAAAIVETVAIVAGRHRALYGDPRVDHAMSELVAAVEVRERGGAAGAQVVGRQVLEAARATRSAALEAARERAARDAREREAARVGEILAVVARAAPALLANAAPARAAPAFPDLHALAAPASMAGAPEGECVVCLEAAPLATLVPCGHTRTCAACVARLPAPVCPECRAPIVSVMRVIL